MSRQLAEQPPKHGITYSCEKGSSATDSVNVQVFSPQIREGTTKHAATIRSPETRRWYDRYFSVSPEGHTDMPPNYDGAALRPLFVVKLTTLHQQEDMR
ncbi:hypothetical protein BaRGS_00024229 [Batillaria attramentaria]|uniref:Uncharacterized protein n=1 Tax=Batillaria attramentaria TaxID=370345 RepID=A0ABD0KBI5_9CAEN